MQTNYCCSSKVSIIVPLLNQKDEWLQQNLNAAVSQTVPCEVIVVVSQRTQKSNIELLERMCTEHINLKYIFEEKPSLANAINVGIEEAKGDRIGLSLSDDWLELDAVEKCIKHQTDIVSTGMRLYNDKHEIFSVRIPSIQKYIRLETLEQKAGYLKHFFLFSKAKLIEIGGIDESVGDSLGVDDYDTIWTLLEHNATVTIVQDPLYNYRDHLGERLTLRSHEDRLESLNKILDKHKVGEEEKKRLIVQKQKWFGKPIHVARKC